MGQICAGRVAGQLNPWTLNLSNPFEQCSNKLHSGSFDGQQDFGLMRLARTCPEEIDLFWRAVYAVLWVIWGPA